MRGRRRTWMLGGSGLITAGVVGMLGYGLLGSPLARVTATITDVVYAAAVTLLAIGITREGSVVGRRPLGLTAMIVVALWPLANSGIGALLAPTSPTDLTVWTAYGYLSILVPAAAGVIAAVQIARSVAVPAPWRWAPLWVLVLQAGVWAIPQIGFAAAGPGSSVQAFVGSLSLLGMLGFLAHTLGLGILAVVLAVRERPDTVEVFRSA